MRCPHFQKSELCTTHRSASVKKEKNDEKNSLNKKHYNKNLEIHDETDKLNNKMNQMNCKIEQIKKQRFEHSGMQILKVNKLDKKENYSLISQCFVGIPTREGFSEVSNKDGKARAHQKLDTKI